MKVMHILSYSPVPPNNGGSLRVYYVMKALTLHHDVTVVTYGTSEDRDLIHEHFDIPKSRIHIIPKHAGRRYRRLTQLLSLGTNHSHYHYELNGPMMEQKVRSLLASESYDVVQTEFPLIGASRCETDAIKILDAHNIEYEIIQRMSETARSAFRKWFYYQEYKKIRNEELGILKRQDALFVTSERDRDKLDVDLPDVPKYVIPNGVDVGYFKAAEVEPEPFSLVFVGTMAYLPNTFGMLYFLDEIFPIIQQEIPQVKVYIVGKNPPQELANRASDQVMVTGMVDDVRPYVDRSSVVIVPLWAGSGTRLKILEAFSMKKPIVTTTIGGEGIDMIHGESAMIADEPEAFARNVIELLRDTDLQRKLSDNGYDLARSCYDWSIIGDQIEAVYQNLVRQINNQEAMVG